MKVKFNSYYKYSFIFEDEKGNAYVNHGDGDDVYRFNAYPEMNMEEDDGKFYIDGLEFEKI